MFNVVDIDMIREILGDLKTSQLIVEQMDELIVQRLPFQVKITAIGMSLQSILL